MRQLRVGNCSGFYGDRLTAMREMLEGGELDVLTGDYLAELTMLILGRDRLKDPSLGYAKTFLRQLEDCLGLAVDRGVRIVVNAGGLNPAGLAGAVRDRGGQPLLRRELPDPVGEAGRVEPSGVRDDAHAQLLGEREVVGELLDERPRVAGRRVLHLVAAEDEHGQLGEVVAGEHVELAALEHLAHRGQPVAVEARAVPDAQHATVTEGHTAPPIGSRPFPDGPAKACARSSHRSASSP